MVWNVPLPSDNPNPAWGTTADYTTDGTNQCPVFNQAIYQEVYLGPATATPTDFYLGRPMSNHSGGFNAAFCNSSVRFLSEDIAYRVYCLLMSPNSQGSFFPSTATQVQYPGATSTPPIGWYKSNGAVTILIPLNDSDFQ